MAEPIKLFVRIPCQETVDSETVRWLLWLRSAAPEADIDLYGTEGWGIAWGRREIAREFLESDATHLWMVDSDTAPPFSLHFLDHAHDYPAITGVYLGVTAKGLRYHLYKELEPYAWAWMHPRHVPKERMMKVDAAGGGCLLLRRDILEKLGPDVFRFEQHPEGGLVGEDMLLGKSLGGLMADTHYVCNHFRRSDLLHVWHSMREDFGRHK